MVSLQMIPSMLWAGVRCFRVRNDSGTEVAVSRLPRLQRWEGGQADSAADFREVGSERRGRERLEMTGMPLPARVTTDLTASIDLGLPAGIYRFCLEYVLLPQHEYHETCSDAFSLPLQFPDAPRFPEQGPPGSVAVYAGQARDGQRVVWARVLNGLSDSLEYGGWSVQLQQREEEWFWQPWFRDVPGAGGPDVTLSLAMHLPPQGILDVRLPPREAVLPPGRYRACFRFRLDGPNAYQEVCSPEVALQEQ